MYRIGYHGGEKVRYLGTAFPLYLVEYRGNAHQFARYSPGGRQPCLANWICE
jgi:hypothetical protein